MVWAVATFFDNHDGLIETGIFFEWDNSARMIFFEFFFFVMDSNRFAVMGTDYEVVVPLRRFRDFALRMSELLATLASVEERSQLQILNDLSFSNADVVRISSELREANDGSIPIEEAVSLVQRS